jgi:hypothetical protein
MADSAAWGRIPGKSSCSAAGCDGGTDDILKTELAMKSPVKKKAPGSPSSNDAVRGTVKKPSETGVSHYRTTEYSGVSP